MPQKCSGFILLLNLVIVLVTDIFKNRQQAERVENRIAVFLFACSTFLCKYMIRIGLTLKEVQITS